ncbi:hypothetical protein [Ochrobactrum sp. BTU1]|jgi:hypothetical protein|uniref:hypothetical protein n=1 Tax=Ochrobactrum sp. BTU1 TaxID=2840456 RepID=UPI001C03C090|nr:hypothetical protein KMS41_18360 [Ochrobactrum sp. BTU1]
MRKKLYNRGNPQFRPVALWLSEPDIVTERKPVVADLGELSKRPSRSKTVWTWAGVAIMSAVSGIGSFLGGLDWRVQIFFSVAIVGFAIYGIKRRSDLFKAVKELQSEFS